MPHSVHGSSTTTMSRLSSASNGSANVFPRAAGTTLLAPDQSTKDQLSPSRSTFSFESGSPKSLQAGSEINAVLDEARGTRSINRGAPGEQKGHGIRQRTQYYEESFAYKDDTISSARERVTKDAPIIVDLRTNVIIKDEYTLVTDLSHHLSQRYQRPDSSIMITVNHSACLLLGGSFEPTYVLTISALPVSLQPTTNKRNAAMIQTFMSESIGVHAERGIVKFVPIPEDCLATNGTTVLGDIERLERQQADDNSGLKRALTKSSKRSLVAKAKSSIQLSRDSSQAVGGRTSPPIRSPGPFDSGVAVNEGQDSLTPLHTGDGALSQKNSAQHSARHRREKSGGKSPMISQLAPPPIPEETSAPRIGKRKSFINIFRR